MKFSEHFPLHNSIYAIGLIATLASSFIFFLANLTGEEDFMTYGFIITHLISLLYWIPLLFRAVFFRKSFNTDTIYPAFILAFISCFSLNSIMRIFDKFPVWCIFLIITISIAFIIIPLLENMPRILQYIITFTLGVAAILLLYLSIYLIPLYTIGIIGFWALGIPLLSLVPLFMLITLLYRAIKYHFFKKMTYGIYFALFIIFAFTTVWSYEVNKINHCISSENKQELPPWINTAQQIPANIITDKILKVDLIYKIPDHNIFNNSFGWSSRNFTGEKIHDPLVITAALLGGKSHLSTDERINILESTRNNRHETIERLWSDKDIETTNIKTFVEIWPQYRISYTEQTLVIKNNYPYDWNQGEAIYTLHLPEGSVVSSLSLWIDGEERKGILTTKDKADSAYKTIVGKEVRDPSLVHWQEGSTVTVRVFPVSPKKDRQFKIGTTTPLQISGNKIKYEPIRFEGTDFSKTKENINIRFMQKPESIEYPSFLKTKEKTSFSYNGKYKTDWQITINQSPVSSNSFHFEGNKYYIRNLEHLNKTAHIKNIYLDINKSWKKEEFDAICKVASGKQIWVNKQTDLIALTEKNKQQLFSELQNLQFSIFPLYKIEKKEESLLISKSTTISPNIKELDQTLFMEKLKEKLNPFEKILFYNLGDNLSPFLQTMLEYRILEYNQGDIKNLQKILQTNKFRVLGLEDDNSVAIDQSGISINKTESAETEKGGVAPDHLMRLFAYNHILKQYTQSWDRDTTISGQLIHEAQKANIVSPISSLIVLETQNDYDRFDIRKIENSIGNAKIIEEETPAGELNIWILSGILILGIGIKKFFHTFASGFIKNNRRT